MSATVSKALSLLAHFGASEPELGLSELARRASADKATVLRQLTALVGAGLLEQDAATRLYRLGAELLRLAHVREASFPTGTVVGPVLARLTKLTGETSHASLLAGGRLGTVGIRDAERSSRVSLEPGQPLGLHATASGLVVLAWSPRSLLESVLAKPLVRHTARTPVEPADLCARVAEARRRGHGEADQSFEDDVHGIATPLFDAAGVATGAVAVATPSHRMSPALRDTIVAALAAASMELSRGLGGRAPDDFGALARGFEHRDTAPRAKRA